MEKIEAPDASPDQEGLTLTDLVFAALRGAYELSYALDAQNAAANLAGDVRERKLTGLLRQAHDALLAAVAGGPADEPDAEPPME